jgi:glycosyltransferase involved in cell wall biosynthesis
MSYRLALMSEISLVKREDGYWAFDLWVQDLEAQVASVTSVTLFSPVVAEARDGATLLPLPSSIKVVALHSPSSLLAREVAAADVLQVPGNFTWRRSRRVREFMRMARRSGTPVILGISSDRATTVVVNAQGQDFARRSKARLESLSIKVSQQYLASRCEGTFVVGEGLRRLVESSSRNLFIGTASWVRQSDMVAVHAARRDHVALKLCAAARLEPMKGIGLALDALPRLIERSPGEAIRLVIAGQGPEEGALRKKCTELGLDAAVSFAGTFGYPGPFFEMLRQQDIVVLTNLNDEQPRLVFDAISQGCLIVCPDSTPYRGLGIPAELQYRRADSADLATAIERACSRLDDLDLREKLRSLVLDATIESMHRKRHDWVRRTVLNAA